MRNQWRCLLLLRRSARSQPLISTPAPLSHSQVLPARSISSTLVSPRQNLTLDRMIQTPFVRFYSSSELAVELPKDLPDQNGIAVLTKIFSQNDSDTEKIKMELESNGIILTHDLVLNALRHFRSAPPAVARRFFKWVSKSGSENERILSSKSYNLMLTLLVENGFVREFWDIVAIMKSIGFGISKNTFVKAMEKFEKSGLSDDVEKLNKLYASGSTDNSVENLCSRVCRVIRRDVWGDDVEKRLRELNIEFSGQLVSMVVENLGNEANKGLIFFRWLEESSIFKHDEQTYCAMLRVLASEGSSDKLWRVVDEMRNAGFEMNRDTYVHVSERFVKKRMIGDAVDLYDFAMGGLSKPPAHDCTFLLKKIVVGKELDIELFSRVLRISKESGNVMSNSTLDAVLKSLVSAGRVGESTKILKVMKEGGFASKSALYCKIAFQLSRGGKHEEASEFMDSLEKDESGADHKTWTALVEGYCMAGDLEKASDSFRKMVEKMGTSNAGCALEVLVGAYCRNKRAADAYNLVSEMISEKELQPWHSTYKLLIRMLLDQEGFKQAVDVLPLMKSHGYPPCLDPFIDYLSKSGSPDDAITFSKAMTVKRFPSTSVFLKLFKAYFEAGRQSEAQDFLSKSPRYIRNNADVLNLFCSMKVGDVAPANVLAA